MIGLDAGTSAVKAVAFGVDRAWQHAEEAEYPLDAPAPGRQEQDPAAIAVAALRALAACVRGAEGARVAAISLGTAMHGLIGLDDARRPLTPLVTWADGRGATQARELRERGLALALQRETGTPVHPMSPLVKILWFTRNEPSLSARVRWWVGLKEHLLLALTGTLATELSSASGSGLLCLATRRWSPMALEVCGASAAQLPEVLPTTAQLPLRAEVARRIGVAPGTPVVVGAGDGPLGNVGTGAMERGEVGISLGTSGAARMVVPEPCVDDRGALFCYALTESHWVVGGAVSNGGIVARWAADALAPDLEGGEDALLALAATAPPGCDGLVMLPYLLPERAPLWDADLPGAYLGLRVAHGRAHLIRAAVEGVCLQLAASVRLLDAMQPVVSLHATGGAFRAPLWREIMAAVMDRPLRVIASSGGTALGAAALGLYALGRVGDLTHAAHALAPGAGDAETVAPDPALAARYAEVQAQLPERIETLQRVAAFQRS
ncbi:MAG: gluconokinase [Thermodesulfobacteriota bacterium]